MAPYKFLNRRTVLTAGGALMFGAALSPWELRAQTNSGKQPIGTIGAGHIGSTIGGLWVKDGHKVLFSSRHPIEGSGGRSRTAGPSRYRRTGDCLRRHCVAHRTLRRPAP